MSQKATQLGQLLKSFRSQIEAGKEIDRIIEILTGDICSLPTANLQKLLQKCGISEDEFLRMTEDQITETVTSILQNQETRADNLIVALDMIFESRYGWPEGTVAEMPLKDILFALEHAMEYDALSKPSIWDLTK